MRELLGATAGESGGRSSQGVRRISNSRRAGSVQAWLYQMRRRHDWSPEQYRLEVWKREPLTWPVGHLTGGSKDQVAPGDLLVFFFTRTGNEDPGLYGWAVVTKLSKRKDDVEFVPLPPTDYLKIDPIWNPIVEEWVERIRGKAKQGTMWRISAAELAVLRDQVRRHAGGFA
jgi:hypothetical protein